MKTHVTATFGAIALALLLVGEPVSLAADVTADRHLIERTPTGKINWTTGWIFAQGIGVPPANAGGAQGKAMAERAAFAVALRNMLETVKGIRVDSQTLVENYMVKDDVIKTQIGGFVKGAQVVKDKTVVQPDGTVELVVKVPLWGADSLYAPLMGAKSVQPREGPPESDDAEAYTGVVVDARGLGVQPACFPELLDEEGGTIFGAGTVDRAAAEKDGMAQYMTLPKEAALSGLMERALLVRPVELAAPKALPREGRRPLRIKGLNKAGSLKANILISHDDAQKIKRDPQIGGALRRSKVVIVTDPMIGGIEGALPHERGIMASLRD